MQQIIDVNALASMSVEDRTKALSEAIAELGVSAKVLTEVARERRTQEAEEARKASEEAHRVYEAAKSDLERRLTDVVTRWASKNSIQTADLLVPPITIREGALVEPLTLKAKPKGRPQSIGTAPRGSVGLESRIGKVEQLRVDDTVYPSWKAVITALELPMPAVESATRSLVKIASAKPGQLSGGVELTGEMIEKARAVIVKAEKIGELTMGELADRLKNGNGSSASESEAQ